MIKDIPNHEGFRCDDRGTVYGKRGKPLIGHVDRCGYHEVLFSENGTTKNHLVHRLILNTFDPRDDSDDLYVNHINGDKLDNRIENLEWCSRSENTKHSYANGLQTKVTNQHGTFKVLCTEQLSAIRELHDAGLIDKEIAKQIGCSRELVSRKIREMNLR